MTLPFQHGVDKKGLYGKFQAGEDRMAEREKWQDKLHETAAYKSLDIAREMKDDMNITNNKSGIGALGAIGIAAAGAGVPTGIIAIAGLAYSLLKEKAETPVAPPPVAPVVAPASVDDVTKKFRIEFYDQNNNPIPVPRRGEQPAE